MTGISEVQASMLRQGIDAWVIYDFRGSNPIFSLLVPGKHHTTRRAVLLIPGTGAPELLVQGLDANQFVGSEFPRHVYLGWQDFADYLKSKLAGRRRIAMEYVPGGALPVVSIVDAGTIELVRSLGVEVVTSADLIQVCAARWSSAARKNHDVASRRVAQVKEEAFDLIRTSVRNGDPINEFQVQQHMMARFAAMNLETPDPPIVAVNAHSGDPHFEVSETSPATINRGDWVLIDLWARVPGDENIFSDITWVGFAGKDVPSRMRDVFEVVRGARDACVARAVTAFAASQPVHGWELDEAARKVIIDAGFGQFIRHRTRHSLSPGPRVHGVGVNIDNLETHDTRQMLPEIGFTVEPGVYLPEFGVRLEIDVFNDPVQGPTVTSGVQDDIVIVA